MMSRHKRTLITGGNGHIASRLAQNLLQQDDAHLILWLHARNHEEFERKRLLLEHRLGPSRGRIEYGFGDLSSKQPFAGVAPDGIRAVVHAAAVTRFNVDAAVANQVNIEGSEKLFRFCERCPDLERVTLLSTVYACGMQEGRVEESPLDPNRHFANHYEWSKWTAEDLLLTRYSRLPWQIMRIATIVAEDDSGAVGQYNAVHNTLKLLYYGLLPLIPGKSDTPLYFVTSKFVAESVCSLLGSARERSIFHVSHTAEESLTLGELIDTATRTFALDANFKRRRVLPPLYSDQTSFERLADSVQGFGGEVMRQSVASVKPFSKQLFVRKLVCNDQLKSQLAAYRAPDPRRLIESVCADLLHSRWGRLPNEATAREEPVAS
jgi:nucleoside-diphosphate-sugar epimerase